MPVYEMVEAFARNWWVLLLRGIVSILFGIVAFTFPGLTLVTLVFLYGAYALVDGIIALWAGVGSRAWALALAGVLGLVVGVAAFLLPGITAVALLVVIAAWAIAHGIFEIVAAIRLRKEITNEWALGLAGAFSVLFGIVLISNPAAGALAMIWVIGAYAIVFGVMMAILAFRIRGMRGRLEQPRRAA
jgi:uncharacterized membrane protein HdeD (DUF308 family)